MAREEPIVTFRTYYDPMLAHIERSRLEDNGIHCFIADENVATINPFYNNAIGGIKLKVFERDLEKCEAILGKEEPQDVQGIPEQVNTDATICPYCSSKNVRYGNATAKRYTGLGIIMSFVFGVMPMFSRKAWHCFNCGKDFKADKPTAMRNEN